MKALKITLILFLIALASSCSRGDRLKNTNEFSRYEIIKIDNCEYINWGVSYGYMNITHKGNCSNPIHQFNTHKPMTNTPLQVLILRHIEGEENKKHIEKLIDLALKIEFENGKRQERLEIAKETVKKYGK